MTRDRRGPRRVLRFYLTVVALIASAAVASPAAAQEGPSLRWHITADAGAGIQDAFAGVRFAQDIVTYGLRLTAARGGGFHPWVGGTRFSRPDLQCVTGLDCNESGWLARAGIAIPLSQEADGQGLGAEARSGVGAGFSDETSLSYLIGFALLWHGLPRVTPMAEFRWEHITGLNLTVLAAGIRIHL